MKHRVTELSSFFYGVRSDIDVILKRGVEQFNTKAESLARNPTEKKINVSLPCPCNRQSGKRKIELQALTLVLTCKNDTQQAIRYAIKLQADFAAMAAMASTYITVSDMYIMPALRRVETMGEVSDEEWDVRSEEFRRQNEEDIQAITKLVETEVVGMRQYMSDQMDILQRQVIEC